MTLSSDTQTAIKRKAITMPKQVWRYKVKGDLNAPIAISMLSTPIAYSELDLTRRKVQVWQEAHPNLPTETRWFRVFRTGEEIPDSAAHLLTVRDPYDGRVMRHLYEVPAPEGK